MKDQRTRNRRSAARRRGWRRRFGGPIAIGTLLLGVTLLIAAFHTISRLTSPTSGPGRANIPSAPVARGDRRPEALSSTRCTAYDKPPTHARPRRFRTAVFCLQDLERRKDGLRTLLSNADLSQVARRHARDMVRRHYFEHRSPGHGSFMDRIAAGGYKPPTGCWSAGENLFASRGSSTPRRVVRAWMNSAAHRRNILGRRWEDFGLGVVATSPYGEPDGLTVVALFGTRSKRRCR